MRAFLAVLAIVVVFSAPLLAGGGQAHAKINCQVRSILARQAKGPVDPRLKFLKRQLRHPPFNAFKSFQLLQLSRLSLVKGRFGAVKLPSRKVARVTFNGAVGNGRRMRLRIHLSITTPRALGYLPGTKYTIANGGTLFVAGAKYGGGTLFVGVTCKK